MAMVAAVLENQGVTNTTEVTYVAVTETGELGDLLAEGERGVKDKAYACR